MLKALLLGVPVGVAFGYALQRGRFCMNTAFRDLALTGDLTMFRAFALAVLVQMVAVNALAELLGFPRGIAPLWWQADLIGGFAFGLGMALGGG